jgi:hypothetical protein
MRDRTCSWHLGSESTAFGPRPSEDRNPAPIGDGDDVLQQALLQPAPPRHVDVECFAAVNPLRLLIISPYIGHAQLAAPLDPAFQYAASALPQVPH